MAKEILRSYASYLLLALAAACVGCYVGYNLHDYGGGVGSAGKQIESAIKSNSEQQASADRITSSADRISSGIAQAQDGICRAESSAASSEQLVKECQQIVSGVRSRGAKNTPAD